MEGSTGYVTDAMKTALTTAFTAVKDDVVSVVVLALPIGLGVAGLFLAIRLGIGFFRSIAH